jgi:hypothetical protein
MALYIFAALLFWNPPTGARGATPDSTLREWADQIAMICSNTRECMRLAAIPSEESRFAPHILNGDCNNDIWRRANKADKVCDSGKAFGPYQIQRQAWESVISQDISTATPADHVGVAAMLLKTRPHAWSVYTVAAAKADTYISTHAPPM